MGHVCRTISGCGATSAHGSGLAGGAFDVDHGHSLARVTVGNSRVNGVVRAHLSYTTARDETGVPSFRVFGT